MQLTLVLPNLLDAPPDALGDADVPALARLLATAASPIAEPDGTLAFACGAVGIAKQHDWPVAPWLARAAGYDTGMRYWFCAEPVTLEVGRDQGRLAGLVGDLDATESAALLSSLRAHFAADGLAFAEGAPGHWWASLADAQQLETSPPGAARGKPLLPYLPRGPDAARWRRWQGEMQMLLFEHPVNRARENGGRPPVNYVWIWGGGTLRAPDPEASPGSLFAETALVHDLARGVGLDAAAIPVSFAALRAAPPAASALVWFDALQTPALQEQLAAFDAHWAAPLEHALDHKEISATLVLGGSGSALSFTPGATGAMRRLRRRWSPSPSLSPLLAAYVDG